MVRDGEIKRKSCPKCGGDLRAEREPEYNIFEWVCLNMCGYRKNVDAPEEKRPPAPPKAAAPERPDTSGMNVNDRNMALNAYYEANKAAIINDFEKLGPTEMRKKWGLSAAGWSNIRKRWFPEAGRSPRHTQKKKDSGSSNTAEVKFSQENLKETAEVGINAEDLHSETLERIGSEVPKRPDTTGLSITERNRRLHEYYEENKVAIIDDFHSLGPDVMIKKWKISWTGWRQMGSRWLPEEVEPPKFKKAIEAVRRKKTERKQEEKRHMQLPAWQENWSDEVKITWLKVFESLTLAGKF